MQNVNVLELHLWPFQVPLLNTIIVSLDYGEKITRRRPNGPRSDYVPRPLGPVHAPQNVNISSASPFQTLCLCPDHTLASTPSDSFSNFSRSHFRKPFAVPIHWETGSSFSSPSLTGSESS